MDVLKSSSVIDVKMNWAPYVSWAVVIILLQMVLDIVERQRNYHSLLDEASLFPIWVHQDIWGSSMGKRKYGPSSTFNLFKQVQQTLPFVQYYLSLCETLRQ